MSDVFREVDEDLRREQLKRLWQRYGRYLIAGAVLIVVIVAGYQILQAQQQARAAASGDRYAEASRLYQDGDLEAALAEFQALVEDGYADYPDLAAMATANIMAEMGDVEAAAAELDAIAADGDTDRTLRDAATIRAANLVAGGESLVETRRRVEQFNEEGNPYRVVALELMAIAAIEEGEAELAIGWLTEMAQDPFATPASTSRAQLLLTYVLSQQSAQTSAVDTPAEEDGAAAPELQDLIQPGPGAGVQEPAIEPVPAQ